MMTIKTDWMDYSVGLDMGAGAAMSVIQMVDKYGNTLQELREIEARYFSNIGCKVKVFLVKGQSDCKTLKLAIVSRIVPHSDSRWLLLLAAVAEMERGVSPVREIDWDYSVLSI